MSSPGFNATIDLRPAASLRAVWVVLAVHVAVILLTFLAVPPRWPGLLLAALILVSWRRLRRPAIAGYGPSAITHLIWHADSTSWTLETAGGGKTGAELLESSVVTSRLMVLNFRCKDGRRLSRALLGDEIEAEALRRFRARLLSGRPSTVKPT